MKNINRRKVHWVFKSDGTYGRTRCYCSICGQHNGIGGIRKNQAKPYCPNCGAKMELTNESKSL